MRYILKQGGMKFSTHASLKTARIALASAKARQYDSWPGLRIFDRKKKRYIE